ncbi:hypothetical protein QTP88_026630 [Uroleucon formosanum]
MTKDGSLWKATKHLLRMRNPPAILRNTNGNWVYSDEDKATIFANYLAGTFQPHNSILLPEKINIIEQFLNSLLQMSLPPKHTSPAEFQYTISKLPRKKSPEEKQYCTGAFLDVSQAFDRVWHAGLLFKLKIILPSNYYLLIKSYLEDRFFSVRYGTATSSPKPIKTGVSQGAVTAPLLFNIFLYDQLTLPMSLIADFANDKALIATNHDPTVASALIQEHLSLLVKCAFNPKPFVLLPKHFSTYLISPYTMTLPSHPFSM